MKNEHDSARSRIALVIGTVLFGLSLTAWMVWRIRHYERETAQFQFDRNADRLVAEVERRNARLVSGLRGVRDLFAASQSVERAEFRAFIGARLGDRVPGGPRLRLY